MDLNMLMRLLGAGGEGEEDHGNVKTVETNEEFDSALKTDKLVAVDFYAEWCMPCKIISPVFAKLSLKYTNVVFLRVDVDALQDIAAKCGIRAMPTFQFYNGGSKIDEFSGADPVQLERKVTDHGGVIDPDYATKKAVTDEAKAKKPKVEGDDTDHGNVINISSRAQMKDLLADNKYVVADFWAGWCGPCRMMAPHFINFSKEILDVKFVKINTEAPGMDDVCDQCRIRALPTFCMFKDGTKIDELSGASPPMLKKMIQKAIK